ncbi:MAG: hypothetical protein H8D23_20620 [Candidatus Brocadiales bacterium]|nr:hypothetical protein [Candidatus Brocadiales bacterium]
MLRFKAKVFTAPRTKNAEDKDTPRAQRKEKLAADKHRKKAEEKDTISQLWEDSINIFTMRYALAN